MRHFLTLVFLLCLGTMLLLSSCRDGESKTTVDFSVQLRLSKDPGRLNPFFTTNAASREVFQYIFLPLAEYDPVSLAFSPILLESLPDGKIIPDGKYQDKLSFDFTILDEAVWPDGTAITGLDYAFTLMAIKHPQSNTARFRSAIANIRQVIVDTDDPKSFTVITDADDMLALERVASIEVLPAHIYDPSGALSQLDVDRISDGEMIDELAQDSAFQAFANRFNDTSFHMERMTGAGPYQLSEWETDQYIRLERVPDYWGSAYADRNFLKANPAEIIFRIIPDENTALTLLKDGQIDIMSISSGTTYAQLKANSELNDKLQFEEEQKMSYYLLLLNNRTAALGDKTVRNALSRLIDVDNAIKILEENAGVRQTSILAPYDDDYNDQLTPIAYDPSVAAEMLQDDGWKDTNADGTLDKSIDGQRVELAFEILVTQAKLGQRIAILLQESAEDIGIDISLRQQSFAITRKENLITGDFDIIPFRLTASLADYDPYGSWHSDNANPVTGNYSGYSSPDADRLIEQIRATTVDDDRDPLYRELQEVIYEDQPVIFLYAPLEKLVINNRVNALTSIKRPCYFANAFTLN